MESQTLVGKIYLFIIERLIFQLWFNSLSYFLNGNHMLFEPFIYFLKNLMQANGS